MTIEQARAIFDQAATQATNSEQRANIELCREYFTNPEFRAALADYVWELNNR